MQDLVGIVRLEARDAGSAGRGWTSSRARGRASGVEGHREYHPGLAHRLDLRNLMGCRKRSPGRRSSARKAAAATSARTFPDKDPAFGTFNIGSSASPTGRCSVSRSRCPKCRRLSSRSLRIRNIMAQATFRIWRGGNDGDGAFKDYTTEVSEGMVVLDAVHRVQADQAPDLACRWNCKAGKCGSCSAEINGNPKLMCMTRLNTLDLTSRYRRADAGVSAHQGPGHRRVLELPRQPGSRSSSRASRTRPMARGGWSSAISIAFRSSASASSASCARTSATCCATTEAGRGLQRPAILRDAAAWKCTRSTPKTGCPT